MLLELHADCLFMAKRIILLIAAACIANGLYAQRYNGNIWIFNINNGVSFDLENSNQNYFNAFTNSEYIHSYEVESSVYDEVNKDTFYFGNADFFNFYIKKNHENLCKIKLSYSWTNGATFVSNEIDKKIELFYLYDYMNNEQNKMETKIHTTTIYNANCENIDNVIIKKNMLDEKLSAVRHSNGIDWWIIGHINAIDSFFIIKYSPINSIEIKYQKIGSISNAKVGEITISNNSKYILSVDGYGIIDLFSFDRCYGILSNYKKIHKKTYSFETSQKKNQAYGCSISPKNRYIYVSTKDSLFQFDIETESKTVLYSHSHPEVYIGQHQLGPDGKIYIAKAVTNGSTMIDSEASRYLGVIHNPDEAGTACNFVWNGFYLNGNISASGLPNNPNYELGPMIGATVEAGTDTFACGSAVRLGAPPPKDGLVYEWTPAAGLSCADCPQPTALPDTSTRYKVVMRDTTLGLGPDCNWTYDLVWVRVPDSCNRVGRTLPVEAETFSVRPNPAQDRITVIRPRSGPALSIEIYDASGRLVRTIALEGDETVLDVSSWPCGVYVARIGSQAVRFAVMR